MSPAATSALILLLFVTQAYVSSVSTYDDCQRRTASPLDGCPNGTIFVSQKDPRAHFRSIQAAIWSLPNDTSSRLILIGAGTYIEQLNVTRAGPLTLLGQSDEPFSGTSYADVTYNTTAHNEVSVHHDASNGKHSFMDNALTSVLTVGPTLNATLVGGGPTASTITDNALFGCTDFRAYNIDFRNEFAAQSSGPAHALGVGYANAGFYSCGFYSYQDTIFAGRNASVFMYDSIVAGQTDFLYGFGTLYISTSTLLLRSCKGGITAWKGTVTAVANKYGAYVTDSKIIAASSTILEDRRGKCSLGRPWNALHRSVIMNCFLDETILPAGYTLWGGQPHGNYGNQTFLAIYGNYGPGSNETAQARSNTTRILDEDQVEDYLRPIDVFMTSEGDQPNIGWIDEAAL